MHWMSLHHIAFNFTETYLIQEDSFCRQAIAVLPEKGKQFTKVFMFYWLEFLLSETRKIRRKSREMRSCMGLRHSCGFGIRLILFRFNRYQNKAFQTESKNIRKILRNRSCSTCLRLGINAIIGDFIEDDMSLPGLFPWISFHSQFSWFPVSRSDFCIPRLAK